GLPAAAAGCDGRPCWLATVPTGTGCGHRARAGTHPLMGGVHDPRHGRAWLYRRAYRPRPGRARPALSGRHPAAGARPGPVRRSGRHGDGGAGRSRRPALAAAGRSRAAGDGRGIGGVVPLAASALGPPGERGPFVRTGVGALLNVLDAAAAWSVPRVSIASSLGVYQGVPDTPYREDARLRQLPIDPIPA